MIEPTVPELAEGEGRISFWWSLTASSLALAGHLEATGDLRGRRVVELGCGLGLAGITAALLGARVTLTDASPEALSAAKAMAGQNGLQGRVRYQCLDWEDAPRPDASYDLVLGSEILYDYASHSGLLKVVPALLSPRGRVVFADRRRLVVSRFLGRLRAAGFGCEETLVSVDEPGSEDREVSLFALARTLPERRSLYHAPSGTR